MSFHTIKLGQNLVISLRGDFDALAVGELRPRFEELVEQRDSDIVVDLSEVDFMDSSGIGALVFMFKRLTSKGRKLAIITGSGQPMQMIEYLRINRTVTTYPDYSTFVAANAQYIESGAEGAA
jgi:anti-anti-sigma factor